MATIHYFDSSALVKLVIQEAESNALRRFLRATSSRATSGLAQVEVVRAVRRYDPTEVPRAARLFRDMFVLSVDDNLRPAGALDPIELRTLDAVHLATARTFGEELAGIVTYDDRMARAAAATGITVFAPR